VKPIAGPDSGCAINKPDENIQGAKSNPNAAAAGRLQRLNQPGADDLKGAF
jgi:hypothetical protein